MREITLDATKGNFDPLIEFVNSELERLGCPAKARLHIDMAIDEVFCNISRYAYGPNVGKVTVGVDYDEQKREFSITFIDGGVAFDPREAPMPDISLMLEDRPIGGLGLFMVNKMMDAMEYRREDGHNVLTLRKRV